MILQHYYLATTRKEVLVVSWSYVEYLSVNTTDVSPTPLARTDADVLPEPLACLAIYFLS